MLPDYVRQVVDAVNRGDYLPSVYSGHTDNLVYSHKGWRVWQSRMTEADGHFGPIATVENLTFKGWEQFNAIR